VGQVQQGHRALADGRDDVMSEATTALIGEGDPRPVTIVNPAGAAEFLLIGDHAGRAVPRSLAALGLSDADLSRHIGWDIGVGALGSALAEALDAVFIRQGYSRLVVDCNRSPDAWDAIAPVSDGTPIPGNQNLTEVARAARFDLIHAPYQAAIGAEIAGRLAAGRPTILVSLHSFTPALAGGPPRPWQVGVLHHRGDTRFAKAVLACLRLEPDLTVGDNEPYAMDRIDYTVPRHAYPQSLPYAELEIRQDLIVDEAGVARWAERLARLLPEAARDATRRG
jgi:predicted N-formylglutamate amidohydrolase